MADTTSNPTRLGDCQKCGCSVYQGCYHSCPTGITAGPSGQVSNAERVLYPLEPSQRIAALEAELSACRSQVARYETAIRWALGERVDENDFAPRPEGAGAYWWRTELRRRAALASSAPLAETRRPTKLNLSDDQSVVGIIVSRIKSNPSMVHEIVRQSAVELQAQALREAADAVPYTITKGHTTFPDWLRRRADDLEGK